MLGGVVKMSLWEIGGSKHLETQSFQETRSSNKRNVLRTKSQATGDKVLARLAHLAPL